MKRLLSLDGGGSWALIQILTLQEKYGNISGHEILKDYDIVIANSGGSIVLAALIANWSPQKCLDLFDKEDIRTSIFRKNSPWKKYFPTGITNLFRIGPRYSTTEKYNAFNTIFKEIKGKDLRTIPEYIGKKDLKIIICTFDSLNKRAKFFKSYSSKNKSEFESMDVIKAIHGSSNAPVNYFDFPAKVKANTSNKFYYLWDGALGGFNNPVASGVVEAIKLGIAIEDLYIVSIGTGNKIPPMEEREKYYMLYRIVLKTRKLQPWNGLKFFFANVLNLSKTILYEPPDWSCYVAYIFKYKTEMDHIKNIKSYIRLSPLIYWDKEMVEEVKELVDKLYHLDMDATEQSDIKLIHQCFEFWKRGQLYNQPIKSDFDKDHHYKLEIGHLTFSQAMRDWEIGI